MGRIVRDQSRVIGFIDMDSFEVQICLKHVYKNWKKFYCTSAIILADKSGERIISVNPIAKQMNISRKDTITSASFKCQNLMVMRKLSEFNKPESKLLRRSSWEVLNTIMKYRNERIQCNMSLEHHPSDEFYLDLTEEVNEIEQFLQYRGDLIGWSNHFRTVCPNAILESNQCYVFKNNNNIPNWLLTGSLKKITQYQERRFLIGVKILNEISNAIFDQTSFYSSVGAAENKLLAKFACTQNKPNGKTAMTHQGFDRVSNYITIDKLKGLGGDLGDQVTDGLWNGQPMTIRQLKGFKKWELKQNLGLDDCDARFVFNCVRGVCDEPVVEKLMTNFISAGKTNYRNPCLLVQRHYDVHEALKDLCFEMAEKLQEDIQRHDRRAECIQVHIRVQYGKISKGNFSIGLEYLYLKNEYQIRKELLLNDVFGQFKQTFNGWLGRVEEIRLSARPKNVVKSPNHNNYI